MARPISKTTKFILALPKTLPAKEVLAKAKASGLKTSESNVHRVRRLHGGRSKASSNGAVHIVAKTGSSVAKAPKQKALRKSDFVRSLSATTPAKAVVAKARAAGIKLDLQYVYKIRSRSKPAAARVSVPRASSARAVPARASRLSSSVEGILRALAAEIGLGRAVEILQGERARVSSITKRLG
jgi:hypothetical protein